MELSNKEIIIYVMILYMPVIKQDQYFVSNIQHTVTLNVDIFACINFCAFPKIGNFAQINIYVF